MPILDLVRHQTWDFRQASFSLPIVRVWVLQGAILVQVFMLRLIPVADAADAISLPGYDAGGKSDGVLGFQ